MRVVREMNRVSKKEVSLNKIDVKDSFSSSKHLTLSWIVNLFKNTFRLFPGCCTMTFIFRNHHLLSAPQLLNSHLN
jgi:hypothetical protein